MQIEYRIVNDEELPPIVITIDEEDKPKVVINKHYHTWLCLYRGEIGGIAKSLYEEIIKILDASLKEQREMERYG
tara:strand:- start:439 stop:663 length:225 start_codon:yes stop_codon:yes gene_type:complete